MRDWTSIILAIGLALVAALAIVFYESPTAIKHHQVKQ